MSTKQKIFSIYLVVGLFFTLYGWLFGATSYKSFAYHIGRGLVWPTVIFPGLGAAIGGLIMIIAVILVLVFVRTPRD
jgi:hypothetical protein